MITLTLTIAVILYVFWKMPKRLKRHEMVFVGLFSAVFQQTVDLYLDVKYNLYGYFSVGVDIEYIPTVLILFPVLGNIFINFFPYSKGAIKQAKYLVFWIIVATSYEWIALQSTYFYYDGWELWWSVLMYPVIFSILAWSLVLYRKYCEPTEK